MSNNLKHNPKSEKVLKKQELLVFISRREGNCNKCGDFLSKNNWITLDDNNSNHVVCVDCSGLSEFEFLPRGNAALTLLVNKYSDKRIIVLRWSTSRKQYERQGILAMKESIEKAKEEKINK
jgi:hypothetical protein